MLTAATATGGSGMSPVAIIYILAALATVTGGILALRQGLTRFVQQRQSEAVDKSKLSDAIQANAEATRENTAALTRMSQEFHDFAAETRATLHAHDERFTRLEQARRTRAPRSQAGLPVRCGQGADDPPCESGTRRGT